MLGQRRKRCANIKTTLGQCLCFQGLFPSKHYMVTRCWFDVGPALSGVCWAMLEYIILSRSNAISVLQGLRE